MAYLLKSTGEKENYGVRWCDFFLESKQSAHCYWHLAVSHFHLLPRDAHRKTGQHASEKQHEVEYLQRAGEELSECGGLEE